MTKTNIIDTRKVDIKGQRILFDANVWILINGFGSDSSSYKAGVYSATYKSLLTNDNVIVTNDYIIGEVFNRCAKLEYEILKQEHDSTQTKFPSLKAFRQSSEFSLAIESVRDTCLNILDDCEFVSVDGKHFDVVDIVTRCASDRIDFSDLVIMDYCRKEALVVMTDDADYMGCGLQIITANRKMLAASSHRA